MFVMLMSLGTRNYHIIWMDMVKSTAQGATSADQKKKQETLIHFIRKCETFENAVSEGKKRRDRKWWLWGKDTGDGYCLCFSKSVEEPYKFAIELQSKLKDHNKSRKSEKEKISIRVGLHSGMLFLREDVFGGPDLSGDPLVLANRVCALGEEWHILASENFGKDVEKSGLFKETIKYIGTYYSKHGRPLKAYNIFSESIGNRLPPLAPELVPFDPARWYRSKVDNFIHPHLPHIELMPLCSSKRGYYPSDFEFLVDPNDFELDSSLIPKVKRLKDWIAISRRVWNGDVARLCKIEERKDGKIILCFKKTKYLLGLLTNFFIDAKFKEWKDSFRAILAPAPLPSLEKSLCSNHLGVNCIIETSEENPKIFLQKISSEVAATALTRPLQLGPSVAGALSFWHSGSVDVASKAPPSPFRGMMMEIIDELGLSPEDIVDMKLMMICRDLQAGGKPNAFFVAKTKLSFHDVRERRQEARERWESLDLVPFDSDNLEKIKELVDNHNNLTSQAKVNLHYYLVTKQNNQHFT